MSIENLDNDRWYKIQDIVRDWYQEQVKNKNLREEFVMVCERVAKVIEAEQIAPEKIKDWLPEAENNEEQKILDNLTNRLKAV